MFIKKYISLLVALLTFVRLPAQLCQGSLGDPIVNITFGAGFNPGPPFSATQNLQYTSANCPSDGFYTIVNQTSNCFGNTWHTVSSDHTGNPNGFFMLINASLQKSEFYRDTVRSLCPSTTYEFAAWIMNVEVPSGCGGTSIKPNVTFIIEKTDGTILQTYETGEINYTSDPTWVQSGFYFTTPSGVPDIVLRIINTASGGCGNDLALDDITFRPCGAKLTPSFSNASVSNTEELCVGKSKDVTYSCTVSSGYNNPSFQWQQSTNGILWNNITGAITTTFERNFPASTPVGNYYSRLTVAEASNLSIPSCTVASGPLVVQVNPPPVAGVLKNTVACQGSQAVLTASGGANYMWTGVNSFSDSGASVTINNAQPANEGIYSVTVTSSVGCSSVDSTVLNVVARPVAAAGFSEKTICFGDSVTLRSSGGTSYQWYPSVGLSSSVISNPVAKPTDTTTYMVVVGNDLSCTDSVAVTINVVALPVANAGADKVIIEGQSVQLDGSATGGNINFTWSPDIYLSNAHSLRPDASPVNDISYFLTVQSDKGCGISKDSMMVKVYKKVIVPNAFSPNGDGINDSWNITALNAYDNYDLSVYNRYGQIIFKSNNYSTPWNGTFNGKPLPVGTYYYIINLRNNLPILKGYVVILR